MNLVADTRLEVVELNDDSIKPTALLQLFRHHCALLVRGLRLDVDGFDSLTKPLARRFLDNPSADRIALGNGVQTVSVGESAFPLHSELARTPIKPDLCAFYCRAAPSIGGETLVCDGVALVEALPSDIRSHFTGVRLCYERDLHQSQWRSVYGVEQPDELERLVESEYQPRLNKIPGSEFSIQLFHERVQERYIVPALHPTGRSAELAWGNFLLFRRYGQKKYNYPTYENGSAVPDTILDIVKNTADKITGEVHWQGGDLLLLDNSRYLHGRRAIQDHKREIWTRFGLLE